MPSDNSIIGLLDLVKDIYLSWFKIHEAASITHPSLA